MIETIDLDRHVVFDASAGTGKTYAIERLVLRLLTERKLPLTSILVVTFTERATGELKDRLRRSIARALDDGPADDVRALLERARGSFDDAPIDTIHAFCHRVLTRFAFENGQPFRMGLADDGLLRPVRLRELMRKQWGMTDAAALGRLLAAAQFPGAIHDNESSWEKDVCRLAGAYRPNAGDRLVPAPQSPKTEEASAVEFVMEQLKVVRGLVGDVDCQRLETNPFRVAYQALHMREDWKRIKLERLIDPVLRFLAAATGSQTVAGAYAELILEIGSYSAFRTDGFAQLKSITLKNPEVCPHLGAIADGLELIRGRLEDSVSNLTGFSAVGVQNDLAAFKSERGLLSFDDMIQSLHAALHKQDESPGAKLLLRQLRDSYCYALVDEFQDTDPLQWQIFRRVFVESDEGHCLAVVGDPKQAIYSFRNADLHTYRHAIDTLTSTPHDAKRYHLNVNWRSTPDMLTATNALFRDGNWFDVPGDPDKSLDCPAVTAPDKSLRRSILYEDRSGRASLTMVTLPTASKWNTVATEGLPSYAAFIADEIARLLGLGMGGGPQLSISGTDGKPVPLAAGNICILVQKKADVPVIERALRRRGVPHTWYKKPGLWQSEEALHLAYVLRAIAEPADVAAFRKALLTRYIAVADTDTDTAGAYAPVGLDRLHHYDGLPPSHPVRQTVTHWQTLALRREWPRLFHTLLHKSGLLIDESVSDDADRRIANHVQIAEHLQAAALDRNLDVHALVDLLDGYRRDASTADEELNLHRLETVDPRVLILTMHTAKGLEFPVVFVAGGLSDGGGSTYLKYHDAGGVVYDLRTSGTMKGRAEAESEAEVRRLYYVACTRAMYKLYLPYHAPQTDSKGNTKYWGGSGLKLMSAAADACNAAGHPVSRVPADAPASAAGGGPQTAKPVTTTDTSSKSGVKSDAPFPLPVPLFPPNVGKFGGRISGVASFTTLSHGHSSRPLVSVEIDEADDAEDLDDEPADAPAAEPESAFELPGGTKTGTLIHDLLEHADFQAVADTDDPDAILAGPNGLLIDACLARHYPSAAPDARRAYQLTCARVLLAALRTPLPEVGRLCDVPVADRLTEMEFHFPLDRGLLPSLAEEVLPKGVTLDAAGFLTGKIDLIFRHSGRCYFLDWKTNRLGGYTPADLADAMTTSRYDLQRAIYAEAVTRFLAQSGSTVRFAGAYYLFLRGLVADGSGVQFVDAATLRGDAS